MANDNISHFAKARRINHINYRLKGSIPRSVLKQAREVRDKAIQAAIIDRGELLSTQTAPTKQATLSTINATYELRLDAYLDKGVYGPMHLRDSKVANIVIDALLNYHRSGEIFLYAVCVMSNHVHLVVGPTDDQESLDLAAFMRLHKGYTAYQVNKILGTTGIAFWERNYFDRVVRNGKFATVMWYVLNNPVKAGLAADWRDWPHTWLNPDFNSLFR